MTADIGISWCPSPPPGTAAAFRVERATGSVFADGQYFCGLGTPGPVTPPAPPCYLVGNADIAERINVSEAVEPGDVVELDPTNPKHYRKARGPYSRLVAGVISTAPGFTLANVPGHRPFLVPAGMTLVINTPLQLSLSQLEAGLGQSTSLLTLSLRALLKGQPRLIVRLQELIWPEQLGALDDTRPLLALLGRVPVKATTENGPIRIGDLLTSASRPGYAMRCADAKQCEGAIIGKALESLEQGTGIIEILVMR